MKILYAGPQDLDNLFHFLREKEDEIIEKRWVKEVIDLFEKDNQFDVVVISELVAAGTTSKVYKGNEINTKKSYITLVNKIKEFEIPILLLAFYHSIENDDEITKMNCPIFQLSSSITFFTKCVEEVADKKIEGLKILESKS